MFGFSSKIKVLKQLAVQSTSPECSTYQIQDIKTGSLISTSNIIYGRAICPETGNIVYEKKFTVADLDSKIWDGVKAKPNASEVINEYAFNAIVEDTVKHFSEGDFILSTTVNPAIEIGAIHIRVVPTSDELIFTGWNLYDTDGKAFYLNVDGIGVISADSNYDHLNPNEHLIGFDGSHQEL